VNPGDAPDRDDLALVERDAVLCGRCDDPDPSDDVVATPAGPLCREHADDLAESMGAGR